MIFSTISVVHTIDDIFSVSSSSEITTASLLDEEDLELADALQKWEVLSIDESISRQVTPKNEEKELSFQRELVPIPDERYHSEKELLMIPLWTDAFWGTYGNKSTIPGAGYVSFI